MHQGHTYTLALKLTLSVVLLAMCGCSDASSDGVDSPEDVASAPRKGVVDLRSDGVTDTTPEVTSPSSDADLGPQDVPRDDEVDSEGGELQPDSAEADSNSADNDPDVDVSDAQLPGGEADASTSNTDTQNSASLDSTLGPNDAIADTPEPQPEVVDNESDALSDTDEASNTDSGESGALDAEEEGDAAALADTQEDVAPPIELLPTAAFSAPANQALIDEGLPVTITAIVTAGDADLETLNWTLLSDVDGLLASESVPADGVISWTTSLLSAGPHTLTLLIATPTNPEATEATLTIGICPVMTPDDFDADIEAAGWKLYGDAYWDAGGWLELTGLESAGGSIYKISETLSASDTTIQFDFYTGGGINGGADGFAMTVIDVDDVEALEDYIELAKNGGCLGYGTDAWCGDVPVEAFHVELDTWHNNNDPFYEPGPSNHIAVTLNGNPADHVLIAEGLNLEDAQWHTLEIVVVGTNVMVNLDGANVIEGDIPGLTFRGGYIGFSGSTGWATNWHRVDNLTVVQECTSL